MATLIPQQSFVRTRSTSRINKRFGPCDVPLFESHDGHTIDPVRTILHPPALEKSIAALDHKLRDNGFPCGMPNDIAAFYRATNGIFDKRDGSNTEIFLPIKEVEIVCHGYPWICELLPPLGNAPEAVYHILWPEIKKGVHLGPGGDWGMQLLVSPETTRTAIAVAEQAWQDGDWETRRHLESVACKIYGSWTAMSRMETAVIRFYYRDLATQSFSSFKHLLETYVMDAIDSWSMGDDGSGDDDNSEQKIFDEECNELKGKEFYDYDWEYGIVHDDKAVGYAFDDGPEIAVVEYLDSDALKSPNVISARKIQDIHCETRKNKFRRLPSPGYVRDKSPPPRKIGQTMHLDTVTVNKHGSSSFIEDNDLD